MKDHAVVIAGGGPTGMMLAGELALAGVDVAIVERRASQDLVGSRAGGLHARTIEVLDQRGIAERFLAEGQKHPAVIFHIPLDISELPTRHNYVLALGQSHIERLLAGWVGELGVKVYRGCDVTGFVQDDTGVDVALSNDQRLRASYLVGCDGGRSLIRKVAGIDFPGWDATTSWLIAEAEMKEAPQFGFHRDALGIHAIGKSDDARRVRLVVTERQLRPTADRTLQDARDALIAVYGTDYGIHSPAWTSSFTDVTRQAAAYRDRRVLLAGDAAHVHPPTGGQGLNIGVQDAVNLGWKLAQVVKRISPETLLDTYHAERHPVAARVLRTTMAQVALRRPDERTKALGDIMAELLGTDAARRQMATEMSGLGVHYALGPKCDAGQQSGHPEHHRLLGRRMPDLDLISADGPLRLFTLLHEAQPVFLNLGAPERLDITPWADRVRSIDATSARTLELPVLGTVPTPTAVLIRPDGYVAWVDGSTQSGFAEVLTTWCGRPDAA